MTIGVRTARGIVVVGLAVLAAACGEQDQTDAIAAAAGANTAPTINGVPQIVVTEGSTYSYTVTASDPNGDALIFGIDGKPPWLSFDVGTGTLSGTPTAADVGTYRGIVVWVSDGESETTLPPFDLTVAPLTNTNNASPTIEGHPDNAVTAGSGYMFQPSASDPDGDRLVFRGYNIPAWASFDTSNGRLSGVPGTSDAGLYENVVIAVNDGRVTITLPPFDILVSLPNVNVPPTIDGTPPATVSVGNTYMFTPSAFDENDDSLVFSIENQPLWMDFDPNTGHIEGAPSEAEVDSYNGIVISVSDGQATDSLSPFTVTVLSASGNSAPTITGSPSHSATEGVEYSFAPSADDVDGDTLTFSISNKPDWATFDSGTGELAGMPGAGDAGFYFGIVISVGDGTDSASLPPFSISVQAAPVENTAPTISGSPSPDATTGTFYFFRPDSGDVDGDNLSFSIENKPGWAFFSATNGALLGTPNAGDAGTYDNIVITVSDGEDTASLPPFSITVVVSGSGGGSGGGGSGGGSGGGGSGNTAPTISGSPSTSATVASGYAFEPSANDADGDSLTFSIENQPSWADFNAGTGELSGVPDAGDVGSYPGIVISVSDGMASDSLPTFTIVVAAVGSGSATLTWVAPTTNSDGSPLMDLAGYDIHWGPSPGNYTNTVTVDNAGITTYTVDNLAPGTHYFATSAFNSSGMRSEFSNEASKTIAP